MTARIMQGNVFDLLPTIKAGSVDCVVTSPPYWMLRSYLPKGHALKHLELGSEKSPGEFVENMVMVFRLVREAMADHATCWLNIGDSYSGGSSGENNVDAYTGTSRQKEADAYKNKRQPFKGIDAGNLCLIPQRLAIALQSDGWLVRSVIVWHKPAPMPASVSGWHWRRCRVKVREGATGGSGKGAHGKGGLGESHSGFDERWYGNGNAQWSDCPGCPKCTPTGGYVLRRGSWRPTSSWEPILMLAKKAGYFCDGEAVKQPPAAATKSRDKYTRVLDDPDEQFAVRHDHETICDGANLRDVWTIASEPLSAKHYAAFPSELVYRCLAAGTSSRGYCPACGRPWARILEVKQYEPEVVPVGVRNVDESRGDKTRKLSGADYNEQAESKTIGWRSTCKCAEQPPRPGLVLDPFSGSGRTAIQAGRLGLDFVGCELNPAYVQMSEALIREENPLFA